MTMRRLATVAAAAAIALATAAQAQEIVVHTHRDDPILRLGTFAFEGGRTLSLTVGIGSGAFRAPSDPPNIFWTVSDRGPNIAAGDAEAIAGVKGEAICGAVRNCRIYPVPDYPPSIYRIEVRDDGTFRVLDAIALKTRSGRPINGLLNPLTVATTENPVDGRGRPLAQNPDAIDAEGIVRLSDGTFWIGEENGPSIVHVAADGRIQRRLVPAGTEKDYAGADYEIVGALPALLAKRFTNRGIESMALSGDERSLFFIVQNPLANPDAAAYADAANTRIYRIDRATQRIDAEWVYVMEPMSAWKGEERKRQNTVRISELLWIGENRLLVDERTEETTKIFEIDLAGATNIVGTKWDEAATSPSLEQSRIADTGIVPVRKVLRFDTVDRPEIPTKIEGLALFGDGSLMIINDDDFGIAGGSTKVIRVKGLPLGR
ncbi:MAG: esterase-like activity of phytase family protein [Rhodospirillales bacterium]